MTNATYPLPSQTLANKAIGVAFVVVFTILLIVVGFDLGRSTAPKPAPNPAPHATPADVPTIGNTICFVSGCYPVDPDGVPYAPQAA